MLGDLLNDQSVIVRVGVATAVVFLPLYILASRGYNWPVLIAIAIVLGVMIKNTGRSF